MTFIRVGTALVAWLFLTIGPTSAITFDLTGNGGLSHRYDFGPIEGTGLGVVAGIINLGPNRPLDTVNVGGTPDEFPKVGQSPDGLGVNSTGLDTSAQVDGFFINDILLLQFTEDVRFVSATFNAVGSNDGFEFWFDDEGNGTLDGDFVSTQDIPGSLTYAFLGDHVGNLFGFGATNSSHDFILSSVTVEAVPIPAALPLFGSALVIAGWFGHRRRRRSCVVE